MTRVAVGHFEPDRPVTFTGFCNHDGFIYFGIGGYKKYVTEKEPGYIYKVDLKTGAWTHFVRGMRMPNGVGVKKSTGDLFFTDNQGEWRKANPIYHMVEGKHYGYPTQLTQTSWAPPPPPDSIQQPAIWIPYRTVGNSPTDMFELNQGEFAGQFLMGDIHMGKVHRAYLEKVNDVYQGAVFTFSGILEAGIQSILQGPDGTIYGGGLGSPAPSSWSYLGRLSGLMKWQRNGKELMDIHRINSTNVGFDITFTDPIRETDLKPENFWVRSWHYGKAEQKYGGVAEDTRDMKITRLEMSPDRKTVALSIEGLQKGRVYQFSFSSGMQSQSGSPLWFPYAWYTLNEIGSESPLTANVQKHASANDFGLAFQNNQLSIVKKNAAAEFTVRIHNASGRRLPYPLKSNQGVFSVTLPKKGVYIVSVSSDLGSFTEKVVSH